MIISLVLGVILGALTVIFAAQNIVTITVTFLAWQLQGSLAVILLLAVMVGVLICTLFTIPEVFKNHIRFSVLKNENKKLENDLQESKNKLAALEAHSQEKSILDLPIV